MSALIEANGIQMVVAKDKLDELRTKFKKGVIVEEVGEYSSKMLEDFERYTAESLLDAAILHSNQTPPDIKEASKKTWMAFTFAVKKLFWNLHIDLVSNVAMKTFSRLALMHPSVDTKDMVDCSYAWDTAKSLKSFGLGGIAMRKDTFDEKKKEIENFVRILSSIDPNEIKIDTDNLIANPPDYLKVEKESGEILNCGTHFSYQYRCF